MILITIIFVGVGTAVFFVAAYYMKLGKQSESWTPISAKILQQGRYMSRSGSGEVQSNKYYVFYEYEVDGKTYESSLISFKPAIVPIYDAKQKFEGKKEITVYYNPEEHSQAVIEKGVDVSNYFMFCASIFFVSAGIAYYVWS
jgi:hypothetical protein